MFSALRVLLGDAGTSGVAASYSYALFTWGAGTAGLGQNVIADSLFPKQVGVQTDWAQVTVSINSYGGHALKFNGTLWGWGENTANGQVGTGNVTDYSSPVQIGSASNWVTIRDLGQGSAFAINSDGELFAWGNNHKGQLGIGTAADVSAPTQVGALQDWLFLGGGSKQACAIKVDGSLWAWGYNASGELGQNDTTNRSSPVQVGAATDWTWAGMGSGHLSAINSSGKLYATGANTKGQLGLNNTTAYSQLVQVGALTDWLQIESDSSSIIARKTDGSLWAWGYNSEGMLMTNNTTTYSSPVQVGARTDWGTVMVEKYNSTTHVIDENGALWGAGNGSAKSVGNNAVGDISSPVQIGGATDWIDVGTCGTGIGIRKIDNNAGYALWTWGSGTYGKLGHGDTVTRSSPAQVGTLNEWSKVSISSQNGIAIKVDGTLWSWGDNSPHGCVGDGTTTDRSSPVQIGNDADWAEANCHNQRSFAIKTDGTLWSWGNGANGELGQNNTTNRSSPTQVGVLTNWATVASGHRNTMLVKTDGTLWGFGQNAGGALGDGTTTVRSSPVQCGALTNWAKVSTQGQHTIAVKTDGTLWAMGHNDDGQLGDGTVTFRSSPVQIGAQTDWADCAARSGTTNGNGFGIKTTGKLYAWGAGTNGGTGQNNTTDLSSPVQVGSLTDWAKLPFNGGLEDAQFAIKTDGTLWAWGNSLSGMLGVRNTTVYSSPIQVGSGGGWHAVASSGYATIALRRPTIAAGTTSGYLFGAGVNVSGAINRLGTNNASPAAYSSFVQIGTLNNWSDISVHTTGGSAVKADGTLWAWGHNTNGSVGDGTTTHRSSPVQIGAVTTWSSVSRGAYGATVAIRTNGTMWSWGDNTTAGQLGLGDTTNRSAPVQIGLLTTWSSAQLGYKHVGAIKTDGTLWTWGRNNQGALGHGDTTSLSSPVKVGTLTDWASFSGGRPHSLAIKTDGTLWAWGDNSNNGQLGLGDVTDRSSPVQVGSLTTWSSVAALYETSFAVKTDGTLWAWGDNSVGALGQGDTTDRSSPTQVGTLTDWATVQQSCGQDAVAAIKTDGTLWAWGSGTSGKFGVGNTTNYSSPVQVGHHTDWLKISMNQFMTQGIRKKYQ